MTTRAEIIVKLDALVDQARKAINEMMAAIPTQPLSDEQINGIAAAIDASMASMGNALRMSAVGAAVAIATVAKEAPRAQN